MRVVVNSPFGLAIRGIRENPKRMLLVGTPVHAKLILAYTFAEITRTVGLDLLSFQLSGNILIMLIIGGVGRLYGAFIGIPLYMLLLDRAAAIDPFHWMFFVGIALILLVRFAPGGKQMTLASPMVDAAAVATTAMVMLETRGLCKRYGAIE
eukprot:gene44158-55708_t